MPGQPGLVHALFTAGRRRRTMGARRSIETVFGEPEAFHGASRNQVLADDLGHILRFDEAVPDGARVNDDGWSMLALVEASGFIYADAFRQSCGSDTVLEQGVDFALAVAGA